ncbi:aminoalcoholphosphotransferase [Microsporum canis CBS 113480]|uniref:diacylglycerol cholinephosphotransferase n=1 Tax=Arthroderma otae (strain ATCC MYA-4605 / CBS 113480) TaxID=554155 RepID=C5FZK6_ARTOC|nr:aminoalcoholphosphotransferase [Microsporum canis CBS 113480]EEQ35309.1 aminoalcoholphosphotransferase [Microsporum canis CBS 113480]
MTYIRAQALDGLKQYKYASVDKSLTSKYILKPFYTNYVINCFPMSMALMQITLTGFSFVVVNFLTLLWYNPTLDKDCPPWVYLSWAVGLFLYQTFDAVDGTQARRTKQSGPLGELFDHGVDACNTALGVLIFAGAVNLGQSWATVLTLFGAVFTFYVQTWEEYHTHVLTLGIVSGPVEGILSLCFVFLTTALLGGGSFWHKPMLSTLGIPYIPLISESTYNLPFTTWWLIYGGVVLLFSTVTSITNVLQVVEKRRAEHRLDPQAYLDTKSTGNNRDSGEDSKYKPLLGLLPAIAPWTLLVPYLYMNPEILNNHLIPVVMFGGLINAYSVGQMIVAHLVKLDFPYQNVLVIPLAVAVIDGLIPRLGLWENSLLGSGPNQVAFIYACLGLAVGVYGSFVVSYPGQRWILLFLVGY